jgi:membrane-associated protease RseP (regulator of RpoE activity)
MKTFVLNGAAVLLALATFGTCFLAGTGFSGVGGFGDSRQAVMFAVAIMVAIGAHAAGHYVAARRSGVEARLPYFVPAFSLSGTGGAYVKLRWPIDDVRVIGRIFAAGPIAGFAVSSVLFLGGLPLSIVVPKTANQFTLGDSLLTGIAQRLVFPGIQPDHDLMLHPIAMAGYFGFFFSVWQMLPVGRLDAGRVAYAAFGSRTAAAISWATIVILIVLAALSVVSVAWVSVAVFGAFTMIRIGRQHPRNAAMQPLDRSMVYAMLAMLALLLLTFVPVPIRLGP